MHANVQDVFWGATRYICFVWSTVGINSLGYR